MIFCFLILAVLVAAVLLCAWHLRETKREVCRLRQKLHAMPAAIDALIERIAALENGTIPDFEKAKAAVAAVNDFNTGLASIMGYDPMKAVKKSRDPEGGASE